MNIEEIKRVITSLPSKEYNQFRDWFTERDWTLWDQQIKEDSQLGCLDFLVEDALEAKEKEQLKEL